MQASRSCGGLRIIVLMLGLFSSLPFFIGFIMPDFFTSVMILVFYLLGFQSAALSRGEKIYFVLLACVAISAHISHLPQAIVLAVLVLLVRVCLGILPGPCCGKWSFFVPIVLATGATLLNNLLIHRVLDHFRPARRSCSRT